MIVSLPFRRACHAAAASMLRLSRHARCLRRRAMRDRAPYAIFHMVAAMLRCRRLRCFAIAYLR